MAIGLPEQEFNQLTQVIEWSMQRLQKPRKNRIDSIKQFTGARYTDQAADKIVPVNLLKLAVQIYIQSLAARAPRVLISAKAEELKSTAANLELAVNELPKELGLRDTFRRLVMEALFSMGVAKVGLHSIGNVLGQPYGTPFVDIVTMDDYFIDMSAKHWDQIQFEGNDYWLTEEQIQESDWFSKKTKASLTKEDRTETALGEHGENRAESISIGGSAEVYKPRIWLRDVWIPDDQLLVTYAVKGKKQLKVTEWEGPRNGPYHKLRFTDVPGNIMPLAPVLIWYDLHELANALFRKLAAGADSYKAIQGFTNDEEAVNNFKKAKHGEGINWRGSKPEKLEAGGVDPRSLAFFIQCRDLFSYFAGNLDALGGLAPMAETFSQDRLLTESAGAQLRDMQARTIDTIREIFRDLSWYEWHDPIRIRQLTKPIPGLPEVKIPVTWSPEERQGNFYEYDLDIDVYSLIDDSPNLKLQRLGMIMQQYIMPLMPLIPTHGEFVKTILGMVAKYADFEELNNISELLIPEESSMQETQSNDIRPPLQTTRTYERISRPGATPRGKNDVLQRVLLGDNPQMGEMAQLG